MASSHPRRPPAEASQPGRLYSLARATLGGRGRRPRGQRRPAAPALASLALSTAHRSACTMSPRAAAVAVLALLACTPAARAFLSFPPGSSVHDSITGDAAASLQIPAKANAALKAATRQPDYDESKISLHADGSVTVHTTDLYRPSHHCDRVPPMDDALAFR